jgi:predicted amidohydrolase
MLRKTLLIAYFLTAWCWTGALSGEETASSENPNTSAVQQSKILLLATCQFPVSDNVTANGEWVRKQMRQAAAQDADLVHFSECALSGYAGVEFKTFESFDWDQQRAEMRSILQLADELDQWVVLGSAHQLTGDHKPHNSLYLINPEGKLVDRYDKRFCTSGDLHHYTAGNHFVVFDVAGVRCGLLICYDIRFPELYREYKKRGVQLMLHSFHNARMDHGMIHPMIMPVSGQVRAATNAMFVSLNNSSVPESWPSLLITPDGRIVQRLVLNQPGIMVHEIDPTKDYYDASGPFRKRSMEMNLQSGDSVDDARSKDRTGL